MGKLDNYGFLQHNPFRLSLVSLKPITFQGAVIRLVKTTPDMGKLDNYGFLQQNLTQKSLDDCPAPVSLLYDGFGYFMYDLQSSG